MYMKRLNISVNFPHTICRAVFHASFTLKMELQKRNILYSLKCNPINVPTEMTKSFPKKYNMDVLVSGEKVVKDYLYKRF